MKDEGEGAMPSMVRRWSLLRSSLWHTFALGTGQASWKVTLLIHGDLPGSAGLVQYRRRWRRASRKVAAGSV